MQVRTIRRHEREQVLDLLHDWISRDFFRRYFEHDPAFRDDLAVVAEDGGRFVATAQILPKTVRADGRELRVGGIGNVFTAAEYRHQGVASAVLERAVEIMEREGFDLSLLFASRLNFYGRLGWTSHRRLLAAVTPPATTAAPRVAVRSFDEARDLPAVMDLYDAYSGARSGTVVRDEAYWRGQLRYAGNPAETFALVERAGRIAAYARLVDLYDVYNVMEHAAAPGEESALVDLLAAVTAPARERGFFLLHLGADPALAATLAARGFGVHEVEDVFWMWRVISPTRLAEKLVLAADAVDAPALFERLFPYRGSVYWTSDRF